MSDRTLGYGVIFFLVIFLLVPVIYLSNKMFRPVYHRTIVFDKVNTLSFLHLDDPVRVRGIEAGKVRSISWKDNKTFVMIETGKQLSLHQDYRIFAEDKGLMGDRYVSIFPGRNDAQPVDPKALLDGIFLIGPTEGIARLNKLTRLVDSTAVLISVLQHGSSSKQSLPDRFNEVMRHFDSVAVSLTRILLKTERAVAGNADTISIMLEKAARLSDAMYTSIPERIVDVQMIIGKIEKVLIEADSLVASSGALVDRVEQMDSVTLLDDFKKLKAQLSMLRDGLNDLRKQGLLLPIRIR
jgi:phospholipid/cholesterol/gamma-HCH transport system substrate-binding protein